MDMSPAMRRDVVNLRRAGNRDGDIESKVKGKEVASVLSCVSRVFRLKYGNSYEGVDEVTYETFLNLAELNIPLIQ